MYERSLQSPCKFRVRGSHLPQQPLNDSLERPGELAKIELPDQGVFKLRSHCSWQKVHPTTVSGGKAVADASERERVVTDTADHVFGLPQFAAGDTTPGMKRIEPRHAHNCGGRWRRSVPGFIGLSKQQAERRGQGTKVRLDDESEIDLESIGKKKYAVSPRAGDHVEMMQGMMLIVQLGRPISEDTW